MKSSDGLADPAGYFNLVETKEKKRRNSHIFSDT